MKEEFEIHFEDLTSPDSLKAHIDELLSTEIVSVQSAIDDILIKLLNQITPVDFHELLEKIKSPKPDSQPIGNLNEMEVPDEINNNTGQQSTIEETSDNGQRLREKHLLVIIIEQLLTIAEMNNWGLCKNLDFVYLYNGSYWCTIDKDQFQKFLGEAAERMGLDVITAKHFQFKEKLMKQFLSAAHLPTPVPSSDTVLINLLNGTFEISNSARFLRPFRKEDFLTYQLPFNYNPDKTAPTFDKYLLKVLPDESCRQVLAEFMGYVFLKNGGSLKLEKALLLYGSGANGKSVFYEISNALLGPENITNFSLQSLTDQNGYYRAMMANKLANYCSEINGSLETSIFKTLVSGEIVSARLPYGKPMQISQYGKLIFNCNELPKEVEQSNAYFRRFIIIPFVVTIPESDQDKELHKNIISIELSGVFNWILDGLNRLLLNKKFTESVAIKVAVDQFKAESDSVRQFLDDRFLIPHSTLTKLIKDLYIDYRCFCNEDGMPPVKKTNFIKRLKVLGFIVERINIGNVVYAGKN